MQVEHPQAGDGPGVPPAAVDVQGETVPVDDDGVFDVGEDARGWLRNFADAYDVDVEDLVREEDSSTDDTPEDDEASELEYEEVSAIEDRIDAGECPWCDEYEGDGVPQHASSAHSDEWEAYKAAVEAE